MLSCFAALFPYSTIYTVQAGNSYLIIARSAGKVGGIRYTPIHLYLHFICRRNVIWSQNFRVSKNALSVYKTNGERKRKKKKICFYS